jgi:hypothetical protein
MVIGAAGTACLRYEATRRGTLTHIHVRLA